MLALEIVALSSGLIVMSRHWISMYLAAGFCWQHRDVENQPTIVYPNKQIWSFSCNLTIQLQTTWITSTISFVNKTYILPNLACFNTGI